MINISFLLLEFLYLSLIISLSFKAITNYAVIKFVKMNEFNIGKRLIETYLHQYIVGFKSK